MKKKLSILLAFVTALTLFTGCGASGSTVVEMDAAYQLMDVSKFNFGDLTPGIQKGDRVVLEESDARLEKACTYEELATYFTAVKVKSAEIADYFTLELVSVDNDNNRVVLHLKDGYYAVGQIEMMFKIDGSTEYRNYDQIYEEYCIGDVPKDNTQWTADVLKEAKFGTETFLYQFNPTDEIVSNKDGKQIIYVATQCENSLGKYTLVEEYEINPTEISFMLRVMNDKNIIKADGSLKVPESETPETEAPETSETPETETPESETPESPDTDPAPEVSSGGFEGTYWLMKHHYPGDVNEYIIASGFYLDGNGKKIIIDNMKVSEKTYDHVETEAVNSGTGYVIYSSEGYGDGLYVLKDDGKLYREWGDEWSGGIDIYEAVSKDEFYKALDYKYPFEGKYYVNTDIGYGFYFDEAYAWVKNSNGETNKYKYQYEDVSESVFFENWVLRCYNEKTLWGINGPVEYKTEFVECDKATYEAIGN